MSAERGSGRRPGVAFVLPRCTRPLRSGHQKGVAGSVGQSVGASRALLGHSTSMAIVAHGHPRGAVGGGTVRVRGCVGTTRSLVVGDRARRYPGRGIRGHQVPAWVLFGYSCRAVWEVPRGHLCHLLGQALGRRFVSSRCRAWADARCSSATPHLHLCAGRLRNTTGCSCTPSELVGRLG